MLLSEPPASPYDVNFRVCGFPIRISWSFWLVGVVFGYPAAQGIDRLFFEQSSGLLPWLLVWVGVLFLSILVHELGHAFAFRACGIPSSVVLYHFGGLAIPQGRGGIGWGTRRLGPWEQIFISAAGPVAQLLLALLLILALRVGGYALLGGPENGVVAEGRAMLLLPRFMDFLPGIEKGVPVTNPGLFSFLDFAFFINLWWPLFNLIPVWPLDGGQIAREVILLLGGTVRQALGISMITAGIAAFYFLQQGQFFAGVMFVSLAASSYQLLNSMGSWRF